MVKNLPCNAGDVSSIPDWEHDMEQACVPQLQSPGATTRESVCHNKGATRTSEDLEGHN